MEISTKCVQAGYEPKKGEPRVLPIYQSTTFKYDNCDQLGQLFDLKADGYFYSRLSNPTVAAVEVKIAELEGGVGAMCTSSGQAATMISILNICKFGDHILTSSTIYGGSLNLIGVTMKKLGIEITFFDPDAPSEEVEKLIQPNTKLIFGETIANPALNIFDIERFANLAHKYNIPLIVDNTFPTPINCRPFEFGADIVVHSTSKYMDGHAMVVGGVIVDSGVFDWANGKFPEFTERDETYHGVIYTKDFGNAAYITKARVQLMRDIGAIPTAMSAFLLNIGLETLHLRVPKHYENALAVATYLENNDKISWVNFPGLESSKYYALAQKYLPNGSCGVISFGVKGGRDACVKFMDKLQLAKIVTHVADARTCVLHPATTTHRQLTDEQLVNAGVPADLIRMSVGIEDVKDIIADIENALNEN